MVGRSPLPDDAADPAGRMRIVLPRSGVCALVRASGTRLECRPRLISGASNPGGSGRMDILAWLEGLGLTLPCQMMAKLQEDQASGGGAPLGQAIDPSATCSFMAG